MRQQENTLPEQSLSTGLIKHLAVIGVSMIALMTSAAFAAISDTEADAGAFCECDEPDAFSGIGRSFSPSQLKQLSDILTDRDEDKRRPIDRLAPENKQANAIGQVYSKAEGFGVGSIVEADDLMLTVVHVSGPVGSKVEFRVGQTSANSKSRWAAVTTGVVIATGRDPIEWSLVRLKDKVGKQFGKMNFEPFKTKRELVMAGIHGKLSFYGYPGFKDPKYLWSQDRVGALSGNAIHATSSSADSGKPLVYHKSNGEWVIADLAQLAGVDPDKGVNLTRKAYRQLWFRQQRHHSRWLGCTRSQ